MDVTARPGARQYERALHDKAVGDADVLRELTEADLEKLGVLLGHRKRVLKAAAALGGAPGNEPRVTAAERRHLTVLFCDLVGSTALSVRLDPRGCGRSWALTAVPPRWLSAAMATSPITWAACSPTSDGPMREDAAESAVRAAAAPKASACPTSPKPRRCLASWMP